MFHSFRILSNKLVVLFNLTLITVFVTLISGCGSSKSDDPSAENKNLFKIKSEEELKQYIAPQVTGSGSPIILFNQQVRINASPEPELAFDTAGTSNNFSTTNLIEDGVDEGDFIKYNGEYLFATQSKSDSGNNWRISNYLRVFKTNASNPSVELIQELLLDEKDEPLNISGMFLLPNNSNQLELIVIATSGYNYLFRNLPFIDNTGNNSGNTNGDAPIWQYLSETKVLKFQQSSSGELIKTGSLVLSGNYNDSRVINNRLILASSGLPRLSNAYQLTQEQIQSELDTATDEEYLPQISINDETKKPAFSATDCNVPAVKPENYAPQMLYFASISTHDLKDANFLCILSESGHFYASLNSLFITNQSFDNSSMVHYIRIINDQLVYTATGKFPGYTGKFRLSEYNNTLRLVSSWWDSVERSSKHQLTTFSLSNIQDGELKELAHIPNESRPEPIGKPRENIQSVRFIKDRAFVVTFEVIDPLYAIDLSDPSDPQIAGELEIPGFSTLLQPLSDNLLLGIGRQDREVKVELFDVSDLKNPQSKAVHLIQEDGAFSQAGWDHHALTTLTNTETQEVKITLPVQYYETTNNNLLPYYNYTNSLFLFEVNMNDISLTFEGEMKANRDNNNLSYYSNYSRSLIDDDKLFYVLGGQIWSSYWDDPETLFEEGK